MTSDAVALGDALVRGARSDPRLRHTADVVVRHAGRTVVAERLLPGGLRNTRSITKAVTAVVAGTVVDAVRARTEPVEPGGVTLHHLLSMQRGAVCSSDDIDELVLRPAPWRPVIESAVHDVPPGQVFRYDNLAFELVGYWLTERTGRSVEDLAAERVLAPLGIGRWRWPSDPDGCSRASGDLALTAESLGRLGQLLLDGGARGATQVVGEGWVAAMGTPHSAGGAPEGLPYGYGVWVGPHFLRLAGWAGQSVTVYPSLDLVVVLTGRDDLLATDWRPAHTLLDRLLPAPDES